MHSLATMAYRTAIAAVVGFAIVHLVALPLAISCDGLEYVQLADVLLSDRFPDAWNAKRTPLLPLMLKGSFWLCGRDAMGAALVPMLLGLGGVLALGHAVRKTVGPGAAAAAMLLAALYPSLIAMQHYVLTETGTFFFVTLILNLVLWRPQTRCGAWTASLLLPLALAVGYFWRQTILYLMPLVAVFLGVRLWQQYRDDQVRSACSESQLSPTARRGGLAIALLQLVLLIALPVVAAATWDRFLDNVAQRNGRPRPDLGAAMLQHGLILHRLLPPDDPYVGEHASAYRQAIAESYYHGHLLSGLRWDLQFQLKPKIFAKPLDKPMPRFFLETACRHPLRYLRGVAECLLLFMGVEGREFENRAFRERILSPHLLHAELITGVEPLQSEFRQQFRRSATNNFLRRFLWSIVPLFDWLLLLASLATVLNMLVGLATRNATPVAFAMLPLFFMDFHAVIHTSLARYIFPVYPIVMGNLAMLPFFLRELKRFSWQRSRPAGTASP